MAKVPVAAAAERFVFLDYLRAIAAWAVVWNHVVASMGVAAGLKPWLVTALHEYVARPLGIIQDFGWLAVAVFFLISGFIITHVALRETVGEFLVKRFFRIFPMLALSVLLACLLLPEIRAQASLAGVLKSMLLLNFFGNGLTTVGAAWTLAIEVLFYLLTALTMRCPRPALLVGINLAIVAVVMRVSSDYGDSFFLFAVNMSYLPFLIAGQVLYFGVHARRFGPRATALWLAACYAAAIYGLHQVQPSFLTVDNSYLISALYAAGLFSVFLVLNARLRPVWLVRLLADTSFACYLVHGIVGLAVFRSALPRWGAGAAVLSTLAVTLAASIVVHYLVERPVLAAGRRIARRLHPVRSPPVQAAA